MSNVSEIGFLIKSSFDNTGVSTATVNLKDLEKVATKIGLPFDQLKDKIGLVDEGLQNLNASKSMIAGMSASAPRVDPMMQRLGASNAEQVGISASDKAYWIERGRQRDMDVRDQLQAENLAKQEHQSATAALTQSDRAYWTERARMRDLGVQREIASQQKSQAAQLLGLQEEKAARTQMILATVRDQQAAARQNNAWMFGQTRDQAAAGGAGGPMIGTKGAMAIQQIGFAAQDFTSQFSNAKTVADGLGRGISATVNNVQMLGMAWGPMGMAVTAVGGALAGIVLPPAIKWLMNSEAEEKALAKIKDRYDDIGDAIRDAVSENDKLSHFEGPQGAQINKDALVRRQDEAQVNMKAANNEAGILSRERQKLEREAEKERQRSASGINSPQMRQRLADNKAELDAATEHAQEMRTEAIAQNHAFGGAMGKIEREERKQADAERKKQLDKEKHDREEGAKFVAKIQQDSLENHGSEQDRLLAKQEREMKEFNKQTAALPGRDTAQAKEELMNRHELEQEQFKADETLKTMTKDRDTLAKAGGTEAAGPISASVRGTAAATSSINRALAGTSSEEQDRKSSLKKMDKQIEIQQGIKDNLKLKVITISA